MFWPAPPSAPFWWHDPQAFWLKIGPRPSEALSVAAKFAEAVENVAALVPGSAAPRDSSLVTLVVSLLLPPVSPIHPHPPSARTAPRAPHRIQCMFRRIRSSSVGVTRSSRDM